MGVPAKRREVVVAVVAATLGGSIVAASFAAASFLRTSHLRRTSRDHFGSTEDFFLRWVRSFFRRLSSKLLNSGTKLGEEQVDDLSKSSTSSIHNVNVKPDPYNPAKRKGYLSWDDYFMAIAFLSAKRSKDPNRQVGACIVSQDQVILGIGYNGFPRGCCDDKLSWAKMSVDKDPLKTKYPYVCHAEVNAILNKNHASAAGQRLYVTMFPCNECAKVIIQAQIAEVVYFTEKGEGQSKTGQEASLAASRKLLTMAGVKVWQYKPSAETLVLEFR